MKNHTSTIIIAGATGLIGRRLAADLAAAQKNVIILTRNPDSTGIQHFRSVSHAVWDGKNQGDWTKHVNGAEAIINLSGQSIGGKRWSSARKSEILQSRIEPTTALVEAIRRATTKPEVLINASAVGFYGNVPEGTVTEDHPAGTDFLGRTCAEWETAALKAHTVGVRVVLLRSGVVLDPTGGALERMLLPFRLFAGGPLGSGNQWFPWIHKVDEVRAILFALETPSLSGPLNLAAPEGTRMKEFARKLGIAMRRPSLFRVPAFVLRVILGEMSDIVLTGQHAVPEKLLKAGFEFRFPTLAGALADLFQ